MTGCNPCIAGCKACSNSNTCLQCFPDYSFSNVTLICSCPVGKFLPACESCHPSCLECSNDSSCLSCAQGFVTGYPNGLCLDCGANGRFNTSTDSCECSPGFFKETGCEKCPVLCATCSGVRACTACLRGTLSYGYCQEASPACMGNDIFNGMECVPCARGFADQRIQRCVTCSYNEVWVDRQECQACPPLTVSEGNRCVSCKEGLLYFNHSCLSSCPNQTLADQAR
jgi:proprotein convertase subtilisin/kexin type 5